MSSSNGRRERSPEDAIQDDVLYAVGSPSQLAVVHLSYAAKPDQPPWPSTTLFDNLMAFIEGRMKSDHDGYVV